MEFLESRAIEAAGARTGYADGRIQNEGRLDRSTKRKRFAVLLPVLAALFVSTRMFGQLDLDAYGIATLESTIGEIELENGSIPIVLEFCTGGEPGAGMITGNWGIPMFESRCYQTGENVAKAILPDGTELLLELPNTGNRIKLGGRIVGEVTEDTIRLEREGKKYEFSKGLLRKMETADGTEFAWRYEGGRDEQVLSVRGRDVLELEKRVSGASGILALEFLRTGESAAVQFDAVPDEILASGLSDFLATVPGVRRISTQDGRTCEVEKTRTEDGFAVQIGDWSEAGDVDLEFDRGGEIRRFNETTYDVSYRPTEEDVTSHTPLITKRTAGDPPEVVKKGRFLTENGTKHVYDPENSWVTHYVKTDGGTRIRKKTKNGREFFRGYYGADGRALMTVEHGVRINWEELRTDESKKFHWPWPTEKKKNPNNERNHE